MLTFTGRLMTPPWSTEPGDDPDLMSIALGLARQPRFAGQTLRRWTVMDHTLLCFELTDGDMSPETILGVMVHDAHEAYLGDLPTPWKTDERRSLEDYLQRRIERALFGRELAPDVEAVKRVDAFALKVEAAHIGPPGIDRHIDVTEVLDYEDWEQFRCLERFMEMTELDKVQTWVKAVEYLRTRLRNLEAPGAPEAEPYG